MDCNLRVKTVWVNVDGANVAIWTADEGIINMEEYVNRFGTSLEIGHSDEKITVEMSIGSPIVADGIDDIACGMPEFITKILDVYDVRDYRVLKYETCVNGAQAMKMWIMSLLTTLSKVFKYDDELMEKVVRENERVADWLVSEIVLGTKERLALHHLPFNTVITIYREG